MGGGGVLYLQLIKNPNHLCLQFVAEYVHDNVYYNHFLYKHALFFKSRIVCALVVITLELLTGMIVILLPQALSLLKSDVTSK